MFVVYKCLRAPLLIHVQLCDPMDNLCPWNFFRQIYCNGLPLPPSGDLPDSGIEPASPALAGRFFTTEPPRETARE